MVATASGIVAVEARNTNSRGPVHDRRRPAARRPPKTYTGTSHPLDPQDLPVGADGTIWVGDFGDSDGTRSSIAVHRIAPGTTSATPSRMTYPDGTKIAPRRSCSTRTTCRSSSPRAGGRARPSTSRSKALVPDASRPGVPALAKVGDFTPDAAGHRGRSAGRHRRRQVGRRQEGRDPHRARSPTSTTSRRRRRRQGDHHGQAAGHPAAGRAGRRGDHLHRRRHQVPDAGRQADRRDGEPEAAELHPVRAAGRHRRRSRPAPPRPRTPPAELLRPS